MDFMGPLPRTLKGNEYILVMVDQFTKWIECIPLPSQNAEDTAKTAVNQFFSRFGYPCQIVTDQGTNFESTLFKEMCELLRIRKDHTTPYRPSANGQAERMNSTIMAAVRSYIRQYNEWDEQLPLIASALRSSVNRHTGFTANRLMLGREIRIPAEIMFPASSRQASQDPATYVETLETAL